MEKQKVLDFLDFLIKELVSNKEAVNIEFTEEDNAYNIIVKVDKEDIGKLIGKGGKTADSIRMITRTVAGKTDKRLFVKINEIV